MQWNNRPFIRCLVDNTRQNFTSQLKISVRIIYQDPECGVYVVVQFYPLFHFVLFYVNV